MEEKEAIKNISIEIAKQIKNIPEVSYLIKIIQGLSIIVIIYIIFLIITKIVQYRRLSKIPEIYKKIESIEKKLERIESKIDKKHKSKNKN